MSNIDFIHEKVDIITRKFDTRDPFEICQSMDIHILIYQKWENYWLSFIKNKDKPSVSVKH